MEEHDCKLIRERAEEEGLSLPLPKSPKLVAKLTKPKKSVGGKK